MSRLILNNSHTKKITTLLKSIIYSSFLYEIRREHKIKNAKNSTAVNQEEVCLY